ncbi:carotenoid 1,2-hydratase [Polynucleobacter brandtiae]|uniref:Putative secreted hydrolase n=1 Tax=Polynucleobacter brandtiae TaxID=1938816 RepID=A0A2M8VH93_9BURK|nr:carotenoid 1,2-hydratase [Polynucleobacter brandtiae]PJI76061.1 putative secreted hydrolase [Polynucleobacter brandtiae]
MSNTLRRLILKNLAVFGFTPSLKSFAASTAPMAPPSPNFPAVLPRALVFPRDYGAHPEYRTEWWYMTGWLGEGQDAIGFQVTFFRSRTRHPESNPSRFAPQQLLFAHAALAIPGEGKLRHAELSGRVGPTGNTFSAIDTNLELSGWRLQRQANDIYTVEIAADTFILKIEARPKSGPVLRGAGGVSSKGPAAQFASYYYSRPQLAISAQITLKDESKGPRIFEQSINKTGLAWFDHEWSSSLMMPGAVGWDWIGINLLDGGSIMAFRMRDAAGNTLFSDWDRRDAGGKLIKNYRNASWNPIGKWRSNRSQFTYPERIALRAENREWMLKPLMQDQEVDARASTGGYYYEGAVELLEQGKVVGRGYLELTGYGAPVTL